MRLACDTGGTFTDLIVEKSNGDWQMYKAATVPGDPASGVINAMKLAAEDAGRPLGEFLADVDTFIHGTTHSINAIITGRTARTAFLATKGHTDMLLLREGGRFDGFDRGVAYPPPYIPRSLTFAVNERVGAGGRVVTPLDEDGLRVTIGELARLKVEAVAVCLLWSIANPTHELRVRELLEEHLPGIPVTLSHQLNPTLREFRRASSAAIDASLKPLMAKYLGSLEARLKEIGFSGQTLVLTSQGGMLDAAELARTPIHSINSGPSLAPVAGRKFAAGFGGRDIVVADTGGTTYDVSLVRGGAIPLTREMWIGQPFSGHLTGFPSVDVKSVGAGGGSIARVDAGGVLHVGPESAGAEPGPVCYSRGGTKPTLADACVVLGYLDPDYFLGGSVKLDREASVRAISEQVARPLGCSVDEAASAILELATENMVQAIADITVNQGIDPAEAVLIGGGGAAGFNSVLIARRLGIDTLIFPEAGAALSAAGALLSDIALDVRATQFMTSADFDFEGANGVLARLEKEARHFLDNTKAPASSHRISFAVEARYEHQVWELDVPLPVSRFESEADLAAFVEAFNRAHAQIFSFRDDMSAVEIIGWSARASCRLHDNEAGRFVAAASEVGDERALRRIYLPREGEVTAKVVGLAQLPQDVSHKGPAIVETPFTTILIDTASSFVRTGDGSLVVTLKHFGGTQ